MITYKIHVIRHGMTSGNLEGRYIGRTDLRLCDAGMEELHALQSSYEYPKVEMVITSPLQRCLQTADILYPDTYAEQWEDFMECDFGEFEGKSVGELSDSYSFQEWISNGMGTPPGGESAAELVARTTRGMQTLFHRMMEERIQSVALITHGGLIASLLYGMGLPKREIMQCSVPNGCGYTLLLTPQLWMRDHAFEIYGVVPYGMTEETLRIQDRKLGGGRESGW